MLDARPIAALAVADDKPIVARDTYETTDARALHHDEVHAQWALCIGAGVGAAAIVAALLWASALVTRTDLWGWWPLPLIVGINVAGGGGVYVGFADHIRANRRWRKREQEHNLELDWHIDKHAAQMAVLVELCDRLEAERDALRNERDALARENARLESENSSLNYEWRKARATPRMVHVEDLVEPEARRHARMLVSEWAEKGKRPSRSDMVPGTLTRTQWDAAYTELGSAKLLDGATRTEAEMLHALSTKWAEPVAVVGQ